MKRTGSIISMLILAAFIHSTGINRNIIHLNADTILNQLQGLEKIDGNRKKANAIHKKALALHKRKKYWDAANLWRDAAKADPSWWKPYFNIACARAMMGNMKSTADFLMIAISVDKSTRVVKYIMSDDDLGAFRFQKTDEYVKLLESVKERYYVKPSYMDVLDNYPIGWSRDGHFAYIENGYDEGIPGYYNNLDIWDARTGTIVKKEHSLSEKKMSVRGFWKKHNKKYSELLKKYNIIQLASFNMPSNTIKKDNQTFMFNTSYKMKRERVNLSFNPKTVKVIDNKSITITLKSKSSEHRLTIKDIRGYLKDLPLLKSIYADRVVVSPFGNYAAIQFGLDKLYNKCDCEACECPVDSKRTTSYKSRLNFIRIP